jgi:hypothetical protein
MTTFITHDTNGRAYLKLSEARAGQSIELDGGFTCAASGPTVLAADDRGLYFLCHDEEAGGADQHHYIAGQADDGEHCIGVYPLTVSLENSHLRNARAL